MLSRPGRVAILAILATALFFWQLRSPLFRFTWPILNFVVGIPLGFGLPWLADVAIFRLGSRLARWSAAVLVIPLLLYSLLFGVISVIASADYKGGKDQSFERFAEVQWRGSVVRLYRTGGGFGVGLGVVVRQERLVFPGVALVRNLDMLNPCGSLEIASTEQGVSVQDDGSECPDLSTSLHEYALKRFLYF